MTVSLRPLLHGLGQRERERVGASRRAPAAPSPSRACTTLRCRPCALSGARRPAPRRALARRAPRTGEPAARRRLSRRRRSTCEVCAFNLTGATTCPPPVHDPDARRRRSPGGGSGRRAGAAGGGAARVDHDAAGRRPPCPAGVVARRRRHLGARPPVPRQPARRARPTRRRRCSVHGRRAQRRPAPSASKREHVTSRGSPGRDRVPSSSAVETTVNGPPVGGLDLVMRHRRCRRCWRPSPSPSALVAHRHVAERPAAGRRQLQLRARGPRCRVSPTVLSPPSVVQRPARRRSRRPRSARSAR